MKLYKLLDEIWPCPDSTLLSKYIIDIETMRARELRNGDKSKLVKPDAQDGPCVTALKEIAEGVVGKEYLSIRKYRG